MERYMQTLSTRIFVSASICFGLIGLSMILTTGINEEPNPILFKLLLTSVVIILPSFALSVASKYL